MTRQNIHTWHSYSQRGVWLAMRANQIQHYYLLNIYTKYQLWHLTNCICIDFFLISYFSSLFLICQFPEYVVVSPCIPSLVIKRCHMMRGYAVGFLGLHTGGSHYDQAHWLPYSTIFVCLISSSVHFWFLVVQDLVSLERSPCSGSNSLMFQGLVFPVLPYRIYLYVSICFQRLLLLLRLITFVPYLLPLLLLSLSKFFNWSFRIP